MKVIMKAAAWVKCWQWRDQAKSRDSEPRKEEEETKEKETAMVSAIFPRVFSSLHLSPKNYNGMQ